MIVPGIKATVQVVSGTPGTGKSYIFGGQMCLECLQERKHLFTTIEPKFLPWTDKNGVEHPGLYAVAQRRFKMDREEVDFYIHYIDPEIVANWEPGQGGCDAVFEWFDSIDSETMGGAIVVIDECHAYCPVTASKQLSEDWMKLLGEMRKYACRLFLVTQDPDKLHKVVVMHSPFRYLLEQGGLRTDPFFKIRMSNWYNLQTIFGFKYRPRFVCIVQRKQAGKWVSERERWFAFDIVIGGLYDTTARRAGDEARSSGQEEKEPHEYMSKLQIVFWFIRQNIFEVLASKTAWQLFAVFLVCCGVMWAASRPGGIGGVIKVFNGWIVSAVTPKKPGKTKKTEAEIKEAEVKKVDAAKDELIESLKARLDRVQRDRRVYYGRVGDSVLLADGWYQDGDKDGLATDSKLSVNGDAVMLGGKRLQLATTTDVEVRKPKVSHSTTDERTQGD